MQIVTRQLGFATGKKLVVLKADRFTLAKRRWRGLAEDGADFGFDLEHPLKHGNIFFHGDDSDYRIEQTPEQVLRIPILSGTQSARIAWQIGNLHFPIAISDHYILAEDDLAVRQMLTREKILFTETTELFQPLLAVTGHGHGPSRSHGAGHHSH
jgi:urease accessory protein